MVYVSRVFDFDEYSSYCKLLQYWGTQFFLSHARHTSSNFRFSIRILAESLFKLKVSYKDYVYHDWFKTIMHRLSESWRNMAIYQEPFMLSWFLSLPSVWEISTNCVVGSYTDTKVLKFTVLMPAFFLLVYLAHSETKSPTFVVQRVVKRWLHFKT